MLTRRLALLASLALAAGRAWAQPQGQAKKPAPHPAKPGAPGHAAPADAGSPANTPLGPVDTTARWAVIIDYATGATLLDKDADLEIPPSSMTKLMTIYIVYSHLADGRLKLTDTMPVTEKAWRMGGSKMFVQLGSTVAIEDLIRGLIVDSGNDACI